MIKMRISVRYTVSYIEINETLFSPNDFDTLGTKLCCLLALLQEFPPVIHRLSSWVNLRKSTNNRKRI